MDTRRFETLIELYHDEIYRYLWRLTSGIDAEDLTQEVFLRAYQAYGRLRPNSNIRAWLYRIATNCAFTLMKRSRRQAQYTVPLSDETHQVLADSAALPLHQAAFNETLGTVRQAIATLPAKQQKALALRHLQGLEYAEIAQVLGCSQDSARANVYQALERLRQELKGEYDD